MATRAEAQTGWRKKTADEAQSRFGYSGPGSSAAAVGAGTAGWSPCETVRVVEHLSTGYRAQDSEV